MSRVFKNPRGASGAPDRSERRAVAVERAERARAALAECHLCARACGANRLRGEPGFCGAVGGPRIHMAQTEVGEERELIPSFTVAFSGCDLRCAFCITGASSWNPHIGTVLSAAALARRATAALAGGARTVTVLGGEPTIHMPFLLELVAALPVEARLVLKTNGYGSDGSRAFLSGMFDVWCVDYKYGNDACAARLAGAPGYSQVLQGNLVWAAHEADLIVRHLLMPGHLDCCWRPAAAWLGAHLPGVKVSLRTGFWPGWQARRHAELNRSVTTLEARQARSIAAEYALHLVE